MATPTSRWSQPVLALRRLLTRPHEDVRAALWIWGVCAAVCLFAGISTADDPTRSEAFTEVRTWLQMWHDGSNVYALPLSVDYPPQALVFFLPLRWVPQVNAETWFACINSVICIAAAWCLMKVIVNYAGMTFTRAQFLAYVLMLVAWSPTRVCIWNGQTTPLVILCCSLGLLLLPRFPMLAGLALAAGTSKPHIALGFLLTAAFLRAWKSLAVAVIAAIAVAVGYTVTVHQSPVLVLRQYLKTLFDVYGGPLFLRGEVDVRPFFIDIFRNYTIGEDLFLLTASGLGIGLLVLTWRARNNPGAVKWVLAASLMWAIAVFPFRRYGLFVIAPAIFFVAWWRPVSSRQLALLAIAVFLVAADVPFLARHAMLNYGTPAMAQYAQLTHYVNRIIIVGCLCAAFTGLIRAGRTASI